MNANPSRWTVAALLAGMLALTGCGHVPTAPIVSSGPMDSGASSSGIYIAPSGDELPTPLPLSASATAVVRGKLGGAVRAGRFTLAIPADAFPGNATVTLTQPNLNEMMVEIRVSPAPKNNLRVPATLSVDASTMALSDLSQSAVWTWNAAAGSFVPLAGSSVDLVAKQVLAPLSTLSGRARVQKL